MSGGMGGVMSGTTLIRVRSVGRHRIHVLVSLVLLVLLLVLPLPPGKTLLLCDTGLLSRLQYFGRMVSLSF